MSELSDFVLDFCRAMGGIVEPPAYGAYDVLLPEAAAAQLGVEPLQRLAFDDQASAEGLTRLSYGHPLVERMVDLAATTPANTRLYITDLRLEKTGLPDLARAAISLPNATLVEVPGVAETRALFRLVRFNFRAALISDEKHEQLTTILMDAQTGAPAPDLTPAEALMLKETPAYTGLNMAPISGAWLPAAGSRPGQPAANPLAPELLRALLQRAAQAAAEALAESLTTQRARAARLLELDRARLHDYYQGLERDLGRRLARADEARRGGLEGKLAATRADHAAKLADAEAKYRLRLELDLLNLAVIVQPKVMLNMRAENRQAGVTRPVVWDPRRRAIEPWTCDVCGLAKTKLLLCANGHLACDRCLAPQCVDCKRVYCAGCVAELTTCAVCGRPVCLKSLTHCAECGRGTCREHQGQCHLSAVAPAADPAPTRQAPRPTPAAEITPPPARRPTRPAPERKKQPPVDRPANRLEVEIRTDAPLVVAFIFTPDGAEVAQRSWRATPNGLHVACYCELRARCPWANRVLPLQSPARVEAQLQAEIDGFRLEYHIPPFRAGIYTMAPYGEFIRLQRLELHGGWKDRRLLRP